MNWELIQQSPNVRVGLAFAISLAFAIIFRVIFFKVVGYYAVKEDAVLLKSLKRRLNWSIFLFIPLITLRIILDLEYPNSLTAIKGFVEILVVVSIAILVAKFIYVSQDVLFSKYDMSGNNNLRARKARTQIIFIRKIGVVIVSIVAFAVILLSFESVRNYGATLLTSAGVAGIIIGFAAQKTLSNLLAGIQIAFTQPIRIDDAVVVEDEWGWVEEINLTYVVVRIWDLRRLVLPITYFTETPFQNWTRSSAQILGSVFLYLDYKVDVNDLREKFDDVLETAPLWDRDKKVLQVSDATDKTMEIRLLMTAKNSPEAWDLRCYVREEMIKYIQEKHSESLPTFRAELTNK